MNGKRGRLEESPPLRVYENGKIRRLRRHPPGSVDETTDEIANIADKWAVQEAHVRWFAVKPQEPYQVAPYKEPWELTLDHPQYQRKDSVLAERALQKLINARVDINFALQLAKNGSTNRLEFLSALGLLIYMIFYPEFGGYGHVLCEFSNLCTQLGYNAWAFAGGDWMCWDWHSLGWLFSFLSIQQDLPVLCRNFRNGIQELFGYVGINSSCFDLEATVLSQTIVTFPEPSIRTITDSTPSNNTTTCIHQPSPISKDTSVHLTSVDQEQPSPSLPPLSTMVTSNPHELEEILGSSTNSTSSSLQSSPNDSFSNSSNMASSITSASTIEQSPSSVTAQDIDLKGNTLDLATEAKSQHEVQIPPQQQEQQPVSSLLDQSSSQVTSSTLAAPITRAPAASAVAATATTPSVTKTTEERNEELIKALTRFDFSQNVEAEISYTKAMLQAELPIDEGRVPDLVQSLACLVDAIDEKWLTISAGDVTAWYTQINDLAVAMDAYKESEPMQTPGMMWMQFRATTALEFLTPKDANHGAAVDSPVASTDQASRADQATSQANGAATEPGDDTVSGPADALDFGGLCSAVHGVSLNADTDTANVEELLDLRQLNTRDNNDADTYVGDGNGNGNGNDYRNGNYNGDGNYNSNHNQSHNSSSSNGNDKGKGKCKVDYNDASEIVSAGSAPSDDEDEDDNVVCTNVFELCNMLEDQTLLHAMSGEISELSKKLDFNLSINAGDIRNITMSLRFITSVKDQRWFTGIGTADVPTWWSLIGAFRNMIGVQKFQETEELKSLTMTTLLGELGEVLGCMHVEEEAEDEGLDQLTGAFEGVSVNNAREEKG